MYTEICAELGEAIAAASTPQTIQLQLILGLLPGSFSAAKYCVCQKSITTTEVCANFVLRCGTVPSWTTGPKQSRTSTNPARKLEPSFFDGLSSPLCRFRKPRSSHDQSNLPPRATAR
jgi:hypothetical protein